ncbi:hypothetical protein [Acidovorax sp.]|uniref:hypothetical protein n=1 Tax=Acidovorax sp. TaxID=1872122 RepID=UPI00391FBC23
MKSIVIDPSKVRDIGPLLLDAEGGLRVLPASDLKGTNAAERLMFGVRHGIYSIPTIELVEYLRERVAGRCAIEIGAGSGVLARALGIPATDNRQQEEPGLKAYYAQLGQPTVPYGEHVERLDASEAVTKYKPEVVIACWVTHRFDPARESAGGSSSGVDEAAIIAACDEYIFIGNEQVHAHKPIWELPHEKQTPAWLFSRAANGSPDFVATWRRAPKS